MSTNKKKNVGERKGCQLQQNPFETLYQKNNYNYSFFKISFVFFLFISGKIININ